MAINKQLEDRKVYWLVTRQPGSRGINGVNQTVSVGHHRCWRRVWVWAWVQVWDQVRGFSFGYGNVSLVFTLVSCNIPILKKKYWLKSIVYLLHLRILYFPRSRISYQEILHLGNSLHQISYLMSGFLIIYYVSCLVSVVYFITFKMLVLG